MNASMWLAASVFFFFKLVVGRCIRSRFLLKNIDEEEQVDDAIVEFPHHLIESLLLPLLPVKSLIRFRSVSKQWDFTISTLNHIINTSHVIYFDYSSAERFFFPTEHLQLRAVPIPDPLRLSSPPRLVQKRFPFSSNLRKFKSRRPWTNPWLLSCMSSCNGLACFLHIRLPQTRSSMKDVSICILNLATNICRRVGELPDDVLGMMRAWSVDLYTTITGFGYDPTINDFKIIFMFRSQSSNDTDYWIPRVMTLKTNTWRTLNHSSNSHDLSRLKSSKIGYSDSVAVGGSVFWIVTLKINAEYMILKFSLVEEMLEFISFPHGEGRRVGTYGVISKLSCHGESLYLIQNKYWIGNINLWILPMTNVSNVWSKVATITIPPSSRIFRKNPFSECRPLGFDCNGHLIIVVEEVLYAYILKEFKFVKLDSSSNCDYLHLVQKETLACPYNKSST